MLFWVALLQSVVFPWDIVLRAGPFMEGFYSNGQRSLGIYERVSSVGGVLSNTMKETLSA
jgi:hypothetical protein